MPKTKNEILSPICAFGSDGSEEVHVVAHECPIQRELGKMPLGKEQEEHVTCIYRSGLRGMVIPPCQHYNGTKQVQRNKRRAYKVLCGAVEE